MARAGLVVVVLISMMCAGVGGVGGVHTEGDANSISHVTTHASFQSLKSCRGLNGILLFLRSALDDLHALQKAPHTEGRLMGKGGRGKVRVRAMQWARKLQLRLLRLCPQQITTILTPASRAVHKQWVVAGGEYLMAVAVHGERPARTLPLRRQKLSHLLDMLFSFFPVSETTTLVTSTHAPEEPESNLEDILMVVNETVEMEEDVVETEEDVEVVEVEEDVVEMEENEVETEENVEEVEAKVEVEEVMREVPDTFLSLGLGPRLIERGWLKFNTSSPRLLTLVGALAPAILRVGGSAANFVTYDRTIPASISEGHSKDNGSHGGQQGEDRGGGREVISDQQEDNEGDQEANDEEQDRGGRCYDSQFSTPTFTNFTMTREDWMKMLHFADAVGMQLLFDLNQFYRTPDGSWDASNARLLLRDACAWGFTSVAWQLGNEPNSYKHKFGITFITGEQMAKDYQTLTNVLEEECPSPALVVGPDVTRPKQHHHHSQSDSQPPHRHHRDNDNTSGTPEEGTAGLEVDAVDFLESFLNTSTFNLSALTWHQYYVNGHEAVVADFMNPEVMNHLVWQVAQVVAVRNHLLPERPIWLTESGSAYGGGAPNMSDAFVGGFLWLDKLGVAAVGGVDVVARETLYQACYALLDPDLHPNPDYWLSLLYKRLVGGRVLRLHMPAAPPTLRLYAHCLRPHAHGTNDTAGVAGGVVVLGMNLGLRALSVRLGHQVAASPVLQYLLQPLDGNLQARQVLLNDEELHLGLEGELPPLLPAVLPPGPFTLPPASLGFWALPRARAPACL